MLTIAEQNEIAASVKQFKDWVTLIEKPDYQRTEEIVKTVGQWVRYPDDLTRLVYDLGVDLAKQNVKYAEILVNPSIHMIAGSSFEAFIEALSDGRDRVKRAWGIDLSWVLTVSRDEPRRADEISRWAAGALGRKAGIVGFGLIGPENLQPVGHFQRAFQNSHKKEIATVAQAGNTDGADGVLETVEALQPNRIIGGWGIAESEQLLEMFSDGEIPLVVGLSDAIYMRRINSVDEHPLRQLHDENVKLVISSDMPAIYHTTLTAEYQLAVEACGLSLDELKEVALNAVRYSFLSDHQKTALIEDFRSEYERLSTDAMTSETQSS